MLAVFAACTIVIGSSAFTKVSVDEQRTNYFKFIGSNPNDPDEYIAVGNWEEIDAPEYECTGFVYTCEISTTLPTKEALVQFLENPSSSPRDPHQSHGAEYMVLSQLGTE